jgi:hypothetical protein
MLINRIVVNKGVVRYIETGLIPEGYELEEMAGEGRITNKELKISCETRAREMVDRHIGKR